MIIKVRRLQWAGRVAQMGETRYMYILSGRERPRRQADNIKMDLKK
jgi:hypothetical protein